MSVEAPSLRVPGLIAGGDLSSSQYKGLRLSAAWTVLAANAAGMACIGILQNKPTSGQAAEVVAAGVSKCNAGAAVTAGAEVMVNASGDIITAATAGSNVIGLALEAAAAANEKFACFISVPAAIV